MQEGLVSSQNHMDAWWDRCGELVVMPFSSLESGITELQKQQHWAEMSMNASSEENAALKEKK